MKVFLIGVFELVTLGLLVSTIVVGLAILATPHYRHELTFEQRWSPARSLPEAKVKPKEATWFPCQNFSACAKA